MPIQTKPLFRTDVLKPKLDLFKLPSRLDAKRGTFRTGEYTLLRIGITPSCWM